MLPTILIYSGLCRRESTLKQCSSATGTTVYGTPYNACSTSQPLDRCFVFKVASSLPGHVLRLYCCVVMILHPATAQYGCSSVCPIQTRQAHRYTRCSRAHLWMTHVFLESVASRWDDIVSRHALLALFSRTNLGKEKIAQIS